MTLTIVVRPVRHYLYRLGSGVGERRYRCRRYFSDILGRPKGSVGDTIGAGPLDEETPCRKRHRVVIEDGCVCGGDLNQPRRIDEGCSSGARDRNRYTRYSKNP